MCYERVHVRSDGRMQAQASAARQSHMSGLRRMEKSRRMFTGGSQEKDGQEIVFDHKEAIND